MTPLLPLEACLARVLPHAAPALPRDLPLAEALGGVLAADLTLAGDMPRRAQALRAGLAVAASGAAVAAGLMIAPAANAASDATWDALAQCESGGNWSINTGNGYYGGLQFSASTWRSVGGTGLPHQHSREEQIKRGQILQARAGWGQWPHCSAQLGLR